MSEQAYDDQFIKKHQKPAEASEKAYNFFMDLYRDRDWEAKVSELPPAWQEVFHFIAKSDHRIENGVVYGIAKADVSKFIDLMKTCNRIAKMTKAPIPGSAQAANPPTEDGIYCKKQPNSSILNSGYQPKFYKVYWNRERTQLLAKEIVLISEAWDEFPGEDDEYGSYPVHHPAISELQYRGAAYRFVTADDIYNPTLEEAIAFGPKYGRCAICGRNLNDELSVALSIGPVCGGRQFGNSFKVMKKMAEARIKEGKQVKGSELLDAIDLDEEVQPDIDSMSVEEMLTRLAELEGRQ